MRVGLIGDLHAEDERVLRVLDRFRQERCALVLSVGDLVDGQGDPNRAIQALRDASVLTVAGNHDRWLLGGSMRTLDHAHRAEELDSTSVEFLRSLPPTREVDTPFGRILLCHGVGSDDMLRLGPHEEGYALQCLEPLAEILERDRIDFMIGGHTHQFMMRRLGQNQFPLARRELVAVNASTLARDQESFAVMLDLELRQATLFDASRGSQKIGRLPIP
ncbi:MAG: metallophosphoesterase [Deltaproteobacteria bacterium]|nr:metallophosphoesterase [Deltaproteobacteria bacterium]